ncbi:MAG TPA: 50S ribosomal protein L19 [Armatimonadota bacterium]
MNRIIEQLEAEQMRSDLPLIEVGDTVKVHQRITEGEGKERRTRVQVFEGVVIGRAGQGVTESIMVRRVTYGIGVERVFPLHAPNLEKFETTRKGDVRRAKLYYLRNRVGKAARVKERSRWSVKSVAARAAEEAAVVAAAEAAAAAQAAAEAAAAEAAAAEAAAAEAAAAVEPPVEAEESAE